MVFDYPKPLRANGRVWNRVDSFAMAIADTQVMYRRSPAPPGYQDYDHISLAVGAGPEFRPKDNELHATLRSAVPFDMPARPNIQIGQQQYAKANLIFYWDVDVQYSPPSVSLSAKFNLNAGRPIKILSGQLSSQAIQGAGLVTNNPGVKDLRGYTDASRNPLDYLKTFWEDLLKAQPLTLQIDSGYKDDSLNLDYELIRPGLDPISGAFDASGKLVITATTAGIAPGDCQIRIVSHTIDPISLNKRDIRYMLIGGRYACSVS